MKANLPSVVQLKRQHKGLSGGNSCMSLGVGFELIFTICVDKKRTDPGRELLTGQVPRGSLLFDLTVIF
jgi:hypothetical protein